ncbi:MAG TPA: hypothetical protein VHK27_01960 [Gammaproteobacteria bacterium]|nr:hypothetical protein [Gammaproteobacteria bacterium]
MNDKVYTVQDGSGNVKYVSATSEDQAFQKLQDSGDNRERETLTFTEGKRDDVPTGADVL